LILLSALLVGGWLFVIIGSWSSMKWSLGRLQPSTARSHNGSLFNPEK
jgi:hypothetical protein